ncbi:hypothetical protein ANCCAN_00735 [Ancylostoma caninum]|uniref:Uncharacterized protein n=1 Tax=Ancylostoma caninum TaxID=29170 RepID=A0A368H996_ANCCA|nr:hypothetical protein ANCCAN_00735 [Ancylostoma caninum]
MGFGGTTSPSDPREFTDVPVGTSTASPATEESSMSPGLIIGIVVAGVAVLLSCVLCGVLLERKRRAEKWRLFKESQEKALQKKKFARKTLKKKKKRRKKTKKGGKSGEKQSSEGKFPTSREQGTQDELSEKTGADSTDKATESSIDNVRKGSADRVSSKDKIQKSKEESKEARKDGGPPMNIDDLMQAIKENKILLATAEDETNRKPRMKKF